MRLRMRLLEEERRKIGRGPKEYKVLLPEELAATKRASERKTVRLNMPASLETARFARDLAAKSLGQDEPARCASSKFCLGHVNLKYSYSTEATIAYLKHLAAKRESRRATLHA